MRELVPLKVTIGLKKSGECLYPNFNKIPSAVRRGLDWSHYVDIFGLRWHYDQTSGHADDSSHSPHGIWLGVIFVLEDFAEAAVKLFPTTVARLTEDELEDFWDNRAHANDPEEIIDREILSDIKSKQDVGAHLTLLQEKALDPEDDEPGIRRNRMRTWKDYKAMMKVSIKED